MHIITRKTLKEAGKKYADADEALKSWYKTARASHWRNLVEVRKTYRDTDYANPYTVFNICGNKYRLTVKIEYAKGMIFIKKFQTHADYSKGF